MTALPYAAAAAIFALGIYGAIASRHVVHQILCIAVAQSGTYVLLLAIGFRTGAGPPVFATAAAAREAADPVVQALALTDVVVSAATTALLLALAMRVVARGGSTHPGRLRAQDDEAS